MFRLQKLKEIWPLSGENMEKDPGSVTMATSKIWYFSGHVFILDDTQRHLMGYDIIPVDKAWMKSKKKPLEIFVEESSSVLTVVQLSRAAFLVILTNGKAELWTYNTTGFDWTKFCSTNLIGSEGGQLTSVIYNAKTSTLFWCEQAVKELTPKMTYSICSANLPKDFTQMAADTIPSVKTEFLSRCGACDLYITGEVLIVWLREPCPPGLFLKWLPHKLTLQVHVHPTGIVTSYRKYTQTLDVKEIIDDSTIYWSAAQPISSMLRVFDFTNERLVCITAKGHCYHVNDKEDMSRSCSLVEATLIGPDTKSAIINNKLVTLQNTLRIHDLNTGALIQKLDVNNNTNAHVINDVHDDVINAEEHILDLCVTSDLLPQCAVLTNKDCYILQEPTASGVFNSRCKEVPVQLALEAAYDQLRDQSSEPEHFSWEEMLNGDKFQSPALMIAMLTEFREKGSKQIADLEKILDQQNIEDRSGDYRHTSLNRKLDPLVKQFWDLHQEKNELFSAYTSKELEVKRTQHTTDSGQQISALVNPSSSLSLESRCASLQILAERSPVRVLQAMLRYLDEGAETDSVRGNHWNTLLGLDPAHHYSDNYMPLFDLLCRLMFSHLPKQLAHLVQAAQIVFNRQTDRHAFLAKTKNLSDHVLSILPEISWSHDLAAAAMATVDLTLSSGAPDADLKSLHLLLKHHLWSPAIMLVKQQPPEMRGPLFSELLSKASQEGVLSQFCSEIFPLTPDSVSFDDLLDKIRVSTERSRKPHSATTLSNQTSGNTRESPEIFSTSPNGMKIKDIRQYLISKLKSTTAD